MHRYVSILEDNSQFSIVLFFSIGLNMPVNKVDQQKIVFSRPKEVAMNHYDRFASVSIYI